MRKILIALLIVIVTMSILWIFAGRQISSLVDHFKTGVSILTPTSDVAYEGTGEGGVLIIGAHRLRLAPINPHVGLTKDNQLAIASGGKLFALGPLQSSENNRLEADALENAPSFRQEQSYLAWPSVEHGLLVHLNRNEYYEYVCSARSGQRLRMVWFRDAAQNTTSLIRVEISDAAR